MTKTVLLTGATDGIGLEVARLLARDGHDLLLHGRNPAKLKTVSAELAEASPGTSVATYVADMSSLSEVRDMAQAITANHSRLDVLINNAGVFRTQPPVTPEGMDVRFLVNTLSPYVLTTGLLPLMGPGSRVVNISSAAQAPVNDDALRGQVTVRDEFSAYAQSKLAITMWTFALAAKLGEDGPAFIAVNPGSLLGTKMVKEGFGTSGNDIGIGSDIILRAALSSEFDHASGRYYDNDARQFGPPHPDALDAKKCSHLIAVVEDVVGGARP